MTAQPIHLIPSFHYDVIYLKGYREYLEISFKNILEALRILEEDAEYTFLIEQVILLQEFWDEHPECRNQLRRVAREGRLAVSPGMFVMPDMNHPDGESLFRQIRCGRQWLRDHLGLEPRCCWIADCWGHHAQLPQILTQAGYETYFFWRCMRRDVMKNNFLWEGLDGSRIQTHWLSRGYGNLRFPSDAEVVNAPDLDLRGCGPRQIRGLCEELSEYGPGPILICNGGDFLFPQASAPAAVAALNESGELPPIQFSTPARYADAVDWEDVSVVRGEFNSNFQGTFTSNIQIKQRTRIGIGHALDLEAWEAVAKRPLPELKEGWSLLLKQQFHDTICGTVCNDGLAESRAELDVAEDLLAAAGREVTPERTRLWFNGLGFERTELVWDDDEPRPVTAAPFATVAGDEVEALGPEETVNLPLELETEHYRASIDADGYITSLSGGDSRELVASGPCPFGSIGMQMDYGDLWLNFEAPLNGGGLASALTRNLPDPYDRSGDNDLANRGTFRATVQSAEAVKRSGGFTEIRQSGTVGFWRLTLRFETRVRFWEPSRRIEFNTRIVPSGKHYRLRVAFPTTMAGGTIRHEIPFGIQARGEHEYVAQNWTDLATQYGGLALLNRGIPGHTVHEGVMMLSLFRSAAMEYKAPSDDSFNEDVVHVFDYAIVPHQAHEDETIVRQGQAFLRPMRRVSATTRPEWCGWELRVPGALISTVRRSGDTAVFLRLYEAVGKATGGVLALPAAVRAMCAADGLEQPVENWHDCGDQVDIDLRPFEIKAFLFKEDRGTS